MATFNVDINSGEEYSFSRIKFGDKAPVLEVELNELQEIITTKLSRIIKAIGEGVFSLNDVGLTFRKNTNLLVLRECVVLHKSGLTAYIPALSTLVDNKYVYMSLVEREVSDSASLKEYGNLKNARELDNKIKDPRYNIETSHRKVVEYTCVCSPTKIDDTEGIKYVLVGTYTNGEFKFEGGSIFNRFNNQVGSLRFSVENGILTVDDGED